MIKDENIPLNERLFGSKEAECEMEAHLENAGMTFTHIGWDDYDNSLEIHGVDPLHRLTPKAQEVIYKAGFSKCYVNHTDHWETHYGFDQDGPFFVQQGWRVSYPSKRSQDPDYKGSIWIEEDCPTWPKDWSKSGYVQIKPPNYTEEQDDAVPDTIRAKISQHARGWLGGPSRYAWLARWLVFLATGKIHRGVPLSE